MTPPSYTIRKYEERDLARVLEITVESFGNASVEQRIDRHFPDVGAPQSWAERKADEVSEDLAGHAAGCFVALVGGEVVGYVTTSVREDRLQGRIPNLAVDRRFRGEGIGRALLDRALADFRERGLRVARIETLADNAAGSHLYPSLGFVEVARQIHFALKLD